jgi:hypothetical protein
VTGADLRGTPGCVIITKGIIVRVGRISKRTNEFAITNLFGR